MATSEQMMQSELLRLVTAGSVDDGKSTLLGRLLWDPLESTCRHASLSIL